MASALKPALLMALCCGPPGTGCTCVCPGDFQACASNLQSLVATLAFCISLSDDMQQGLNARDQVVFDEQLAALPQVSKAEESVAAAAAQVVVAWTRLCKAMVLVNILG